MECSQRSFCMFLAACLFVLGSGWCCAGQVRVAAASNFRDTMSTLAGRFENETEHQVTLIFGSTGKHYAQIMNGAPFDAFFAADTSRPMRLEEKNRIVPGSRFTYALGKLALWSPVEAYVDSGGEILKTGNFRHLAIANPALAPYGEAAREVIEGLGLWEELEQRLVRGENVGQAFLYVSSGNAELGFIAWSQLKGKNRAVKGSYWLVPDGLYQPIEQQAVLLSDNAASRAFMSFIRSDEAASIISADGYELAE